MDGLLGNVVMPTITKTFSVSLAQCIRDAEGPARMAIASGESIRWAHGQGCANSSRPSTAQGTVTVANAIIGATWKHEDEDMGEPLFGAHLRRTIRVFRNAFRR